MAQSPFFSPLVLLVCFLDRKTTKKTNRQTKISTVCIRKQRSKVAITSEEIQRVEEKTVRSAEKMLKSCCLNGMQYSSWKNINRPFEKSTRLMSKD